MPEKDTGMIFIEAVEPFLSRESRNQVTANIDIIEQRIVVNEYMGHLIKKLQKALQFACEDAADGCCPYEAIDYYKSEECKNCPKLIEDWVDPEDCKYHGINARCWGKHYVAKAIE